MQYCDSVRLRRLLRPCSTWQDGDHANERNELAPSHASLPPGTTPKKEPSLPASEMAERDAISRMQDRLRLGGHPMDDEHQPCRLSGIRHLQHDHQPWRCI